MEPSVPANKIHDVSKGMFITLLKGGLSGLVLGYLLALLLGRSVWLEMRVNIGLAIPVCTLACILFSLWKRITIRYSVFLFLELSLIVTFLFLYRFELDAFLVIPACLFREGCHLNFADLGFINVLLAMILFAGNFLWLFRAPQNLKGGRLVLAKSSSKSLLKDRLEISLRKERNMEKKDYRPMWKDLGLNLEGHDQLLAIMGKAYKDIYMSQENRPKAMQYLDFVISEAHGLRIEELMEQKKKGNKVIGTFCVYVPEELILAVGGTCVGLCAGAEIGIDEAEKVLPRNTCALIKSFMGFKLAGLCPYIQASDLVVGETTCDGKKKAYEILNDYKETYVMEIPQMKTERDRTLWRGEVIQFKEKIEELTGRKITADNLREGIKIANDKRRALQRLSALRKATPSPISGLDALLVNQIAFYDDPLRFTKNIHALCDELEDRVKKGIGVTKNGAPRILIAGSPMALPNWKIPFIVETSGAIVVAEESCVGERSTRDLVDETGKTLDEMIDAIVGRYFKIDCACFTPNEERTGHILDLARGFKVNGVIHYSIQFCTPYSVEAYKVEKALQNKEIPCLKIETDYGMEDMGQLKTRIEAFLEMVRG